MAKLTTLILLSLAVSMQAGLQAVPIPVPTNSFALGYGQNLTQDLGVTPAYIQRPSPGWAVVTEGVYVLTFYVTNQLPSYPGYYDVRINFGTQELCHAEAWALKYSTKVIAVCPSPGYIVVDKSLPDGGPVQSGNNLVLSATVPAWQLQFSNVSLEFHRSESLYPYQ